MRRRPFTASAAVSLLLLAAVCGVWVRSHFVVDEVMFSTGVGERRADNVIARSYAGNFAVHWHRFTFPATERDAFVQHARRGRASPRWQRDVWYYEDPGVYQLYHGNRGRGWFGTKTQQATGTWNVNGVVWVKRSVHFPLGCAALVLAVCPAVWAWRWRRLRRQSMVGRCLACGYDLRATPERCPECGTVPAASPTGG